MDQRLTQQEKPGQVAALATNTVLHRKCSCGQHTLANGECQACRQKRDRTLQLSAVNAGSTNGLPPIVHEVLRSPGQPLDTATRVFMEPCFGHDFGAVRVHTVAQAAYGGWRS